MPMPCASDVTAPSQDVFVIKDRLHILFSCFGLVRRLDLVRTGQGQSPRLMCFLRMSSPDEEQAVVDALGLGRFGGDLVMVLGPHGAPCERLAGSEALPAASAWPWPD
jgi:hypothetical protein